MAVVSSFTAGASRDAARQAGEDALGAVGVRMSTMVVPVPWLLDELLKSSTRMSPAVTEPTVRVTGQMAYGLMSPFGGVVEPSSVSSTFPARKDPAAGRSTDWAACSSAVYCGLAGAAA